MTSKYVFLLFFTAVLGIGQVTAQTSSKDSSGEVSRKQTEAIVREYLLKNPEIIREALAALDAKEAAERKRIAAVKLRSKQKDLFMNAADPVAGDSAGDVSIAVFFDYACGYCRSTLPGLKTLIESDPRVRIVYKEFPILGPNSRTAALAALAAGRQGKYIEFHHKLLSSRDLSDQGIKAIAMELGLDHAQLMRDMADPVFAGLITTNAALANELDINGVPAYVINDQIVPGAIDAASLAKIIEKHRAKAKEGVVAGAK
ncbi:MAG: DsbA family protein [Acidobacteria bacterium]|nr:DsbA family protein [Acidobacteriota bacterium]